MKRDFSVGILLFVLLGLFLSPPSLSGQSSRIKHTKKQKYRIEPIVPHARLPIKTLPRNGKLAFIEWRKARLNRAGSSDTKTKRGKSTSIKARISPNRRFGKHRFVRWRKNVFQNT